jgi:hypothetical protein
MVDVLDCLQYSKCLGSLGKLQCCLSSTEGENRDGYGFHAACYRAF